MVAMLNLLNILPWIFFIMCIIGTVVCVGSLIIMYEFWENLEGNPLNMSKYTIKAHI